MEATRPTIDASLLDQDVGFGLKPAKKIRAVS